MFKARLYARSPRYEQWRRILGSDDIPLAGLRSHFANLGDETGVEFYPLDVNRLTPEQRERLVRFLSARHNAPRRSVEEQLDTVGFPVRSADVVVAISLRYVL
jgi:hypothetical protein